MKKQKCKNCGREIRFVPEHIPQKGNYKPCGKVVLEKRQDDTSS